MRVRSEELLKGLRQVKASVGEKGSIPILECVKFDVKGNELTLTTSSLNTSSVYRMEVESDKDETFCLKFKQLFSFCSTLGGEIETRLTNSKAHFSCNKTKAQFSLLSADEYPNVEMVSGSSFTLNGARFYEVIDRIAMCAGSSGYESFGTLLEITKDFFQLVASDGSRLALARMELASDIETRAALSNDTVGILHTLLKGVSGDCILTLSDKKIQAVVGNTTVIAVLLNNNFPDYSAVLIQSPNHTAKFVVEDLVASSRRINAVVDDFSVREIVLEIGQESAKISGISSNNDSVEDTVRCESSCDGITVRYNVSMLMDFLKVAREFVVFSWKEVARAVKLTDLNEDAMYIMMPIVRETPIISSEEEEN